MSCYVMLCYVMPCHVMLHYVMLFYVMLVMLCYIMSCHVMTTPFTSLSVHIGYSASSNYSISFYIQRVSGILNTLGGGSMDYSE